MDGVEKYVCKVEADEVEVAVAFLLVAFLLFSLPFGRPAVGFASDSSSSLESAMES